MTEQIKIQEHDTIPLEKYQDVKDILDEIQWKGLPDYMSTPIHLGIDANLIAGYFIGADWLKEQQLSIVVTPKIQNIDYMLMFEKALDIVDESSYFSKCYGINFNQPLISTSSVQTILTPLLIIHFVSILTQLLKRGLCKDYVLVEENLKGKIKGRILPLQNLRHNILQSRKDRIECVYQKYTEDTLENRLLKKALLFARSALYSLKYKSLPLKVNQILTHFVNVSDEISITQVHNIKARKIYREYPEAIELAKTILRHFDYAMSQTEEPSHFTHPFWIDMSRLYEMYVLGILQKKYPNQIEFQVSGSFHTQVDYIHRQEHLIMDAKYKPQYAYTLKGIVDDIREISGYARDKKIIKHFDKECVNGEEEIKCLIIYPETRIVILSKQEQQDSIKDDVDMINALNQEQSILNLDSKTSLWDCAVDIPPYRNFRKISIPLPIINETAIN